MLKSSDGFFSYIYPTVDSLDELTVTTSAGSAIPAAGPAQIKFTTKERSNQFHGGGFYQRRQTVGTPTTISIINKTCRATS